MRYAFIHAIALLAVLLFCGTASADGSQVVSTSTGQTYTVIPNGQTSSILVNNKTHEVSIVVNQPPRETAEAVAKRQRARKSR